MWEFCPLCHVLILRGALNRGALAPRCYNSLGFILPAFLSPRVGWVGRAGEAATQKHHTSLVLRPLMSQTLPRVEFPRTPRPCLDLDFCRRQTPAPVCIQPVCLGSAGTSCYCWVNEHIGPYPGLSGMLIKQLVCEPGGQRANGFLDPISVCVCVCV